MATITEIQAAIIRAQTAGDTEQVAALRAQLAEAQGQAPAMPGAAGSNPALPSTPVTQPTGRLRYTMAADNTFSGGDDWRQPQILIPGRIRAKMVGLPRAVGEKGDWVLEFKSVSGFNAQGVMDPSAESLDFPLWFNWAKRAWIMREVLKNLGLSYKWDGQHLDITDDRFAVGLEVDVELEVSDYQGAKNPVQIKSSGFDVGIRAVETVSI